MTIRPLLGGISSYIPGLHLLLRGIISYIPGLHNEGEVGTISARYCYSVWMRHLIMAHNNALSTCPNVIAELGPGPSLGTGLAALISGASKYYALDVVRGVDNQKNLKILEELIDLFKEHEGIPHEDEFPTIKPYLESYDFPSHILTAERLSASLRPERIQSIRNALLKPNTPNAGDIQISYFVPWYDPEVIKESSVDMIYAQAVLQHVDDISHTYEAIYRWLKPGGFISHQVDFKCCGTAPEWNGHWTYGDLKWKMIKGRRPYLLNRQPHSTHINLLKQFKFEVVCDIRIKTASAISRKRLAPRFKDMSEEDLTTSGAFIQAIKRT